MRLPKSLHWRITLAYTALIILTLGVASFYLVTFVRSTYLTNLETRLEQEARLVAEATARYFPAQTDAAALQAASERMSATISARVTLIAPDGAVLADSWEDPASLANQAQQPEVRRALAAAVGSHTRSDAADEDLIHVAVPIVVDERVLGVARVAEPVAQVQEIVNRNIAVVGLIGIAGGVLAVLIGFVVASRTSRSIGALTEGARQLAAGELDYRVPVPARGSHETQELAQAFNRMAASLRDHVRDLSVEQGKLAALLNTLADGVVVIDGSGQVVLLNRAAAQILTIDGDSVLGRRFAEVVRDYSLQQLVTRCAEQREVQHGEVEIPQWRRYLSAIATPLADQDESSVLLTMHDLTRIRQVETTRKEFVSNVSHELRGPLAAVKVLVESLASGALKEKKRSKDFLKRIDGEVDRMTAMVNELMRLSRLESDQAGLQLEPLDLGPFLAALQEEHQARTAKRGIALDLDVPDRLARVRGDEDKLRQVFDNLLSNAVKFTPADGRIALSAQQENGVVRLRVADSGVGIPRKHLPHIFERFYKVDRSRHSEGFGLGLAIVKHIVQAHGGRIHAESVEGQGTTFTVSLPVETDESG